MKRIKRTLSLLKHYWELRFTPPQQYALKQGVTIGVNNFIADNECWSTEPFLIKVGNHCQITAGVKFLTHGGGQAVRRFVPDMDTFGTAFPSQPVFPPGVTIEDNVLVAAGSVVTKSIPSGMVVGGNPARIICTIEEFIERNKNTNSHTKGISREEKLRILKTMGEEKFVRKKFMIK